MACPSSGQYLPSADFIAAGYPLGPATGAKLLCQLTRLARSLATGGAVCAEFAGEDRRRVGMEALAEGEGRVAQLRPPQVEELEESGAGRAVEDGIALFFHGGAQDHQIVVVTQEFVQHFVVAGQLFHEHRADAPEQSEVQGKILCPLPPAV